MRTPILLLVKDKPSTNLAKLAAYLNPVKTAYVESMVPALTKTPVTKKFIEKQINRQIKDQIQQAAERSLNEDVSGSIGQVVDDRVENKGSNSEPVPDQRRN